AVALPPLARRERLAVPLARPLARAGDGLRAARARFRGAFFVAPMPTAAAAFLATPATAPAAVPTAEPTRWAAVPTPEATVLAAGPTTEVTVLTADPTPDVTLPTMPLLSVSAIDPPYRGGYRVDESTPPRAFALAPIGTHLLSTRTA